MSRPSSGTAPSQLPRCGEAIFSSVACAPPTLRSSARPYSKTLIVMAHPLRAGFGSYSASARRARRQLSGRRGDARGKGLRSERAAEIGGAPFGLGDHGVERALDQLAGANEALVVAPLAEPGEQHAGGADERRRVGAVLSGDVGRRA